MVGPGGALLQPLQQQGVAVCGADRRDADIEIRPVKARDDRGLRGDLKRRADVFDHRGRRGRRQRQCPRSRLTDFAAAASFR